jgi:drug/metabolite transporter (DMT)-like permease
MQQSNQKKAYGLALLAVMFWSTMSSAFKITLRYLSYDELVFWSVLNGVIILFLVNIIRSKRWNKLDGAKKSLGYSALMGFFNPFLYYLVLMKAYELLEAQVAGTLNYIWPVVLVILSVPLLGQKIKALSFGAMFLSFFGIVLIVTQGKLTSLHFTNLTGVFLALASAFFWALYWIVNLKDKRDALPKILLNNVFGLLYLLLFFALTDHEMDFPSAKGYLGSLYIGIFELGITFVIWLKALEYSPDTAKVSNLIYLSPFLGLFWIRQTVGETIHWFTLVGLGFIVGGIILQGLIGSGEGKNTKTVS